MHSFICSIFVPSLRRCCNPLLLVHLDFLEWKLKLFFLFENICRYKKMFMKIKLKFLKLCENKYSCFTRIIKSICTVIVVLN